MLKRLAVFLIVLFSLYGIAYAQTFNVATTAQLRTAFENASVNGSDDTIILEAGTYKTTADGIGTFKFSDTEAHNLTIKAKDGLTANDVILDGANTHQVLNLTSTNTATTFTLDRVTIRNGKSSTSGGGVYSGNTVTVTNSTISGNTASGSGGGIYGSTVTVTNSTISGNSGGGIYGSTVTVTNSTISGNSGGGINGSTVTVTNSTISGNTGASSVSGGGINGSTVTITNSTISGNTVSCGVYSMCSVYGGGIYGFTVTVANSTISGNSANGGSGSWGSSGYGSGIYGSTVIVTNSTISGNTASGSYGSGGGISGSTVSVTNSTISGNTGSSGGGIYGHGTFINNIFDNNSSDIYFSGNSNVYNNHIDYTKLQNESSYTIIKKNNIQPSSGSLSFADSSFRLGAGSVAIDKGLDPNSTTFTNLFTGHATTLQTIQTALQTDKDGNTRIIGSAIDLGAYEYVTSTFTLSTTSQTFTSTAGTASITVTGSGSWTATSTLSWVTITSGASGAGNGTVVITVAANTTGATRTGNITIAGQTVVITQSAAGGSAVSLVTTTAQTSYSTIQAAYNANTAASGSSILVQGTTLTEALVFNQNNSITLTGGYDSTFTTVGATMTTVSGSLTISSGAVTVANLVIQ